MSRNSYDAEFGVCRIRWQRNEPSSESGPVLVEVWRPSVEGLLYGEATKPTIRVKAMVEVRVFKDSKWWKVGWGGDLSAVTDGKIRRWAPLPFRWWSQTITLDGWRKE